MFRAIARMAGPALQSSLSNRLGSFGGAVAASRPEASIPNLNFRRWISLLPDVKPVAPVFDPLQQDLTKSCLTLFEIALKLEYSAGQVRGGWR